MPRLAKFLVLAALPLAAAIAGVLYGISHGHVHAPPPPKPLILAKNSALAPVVAFTDGAGKRHALSEYRGHYVLLNLWATWCGPCVKELPSLAALKQTIPALTVLAVDDTGRSETAAQAAAFLKDHQADALGAHVDSDAVFIRAFRAYGLPLTVLIDPKGEMIAQAEGPADWSGPDSIAYFKALTSEPPAS